MKNGFLLIIAGFLAGLASLNANADNWAGATVGVTVGHAWHESKGKGDSFDDTDPDALAVWHMTNRGRTDGKYMLGLKAGYDWQAGNYVYGISADWNHVNASNKSGMLDSGNYSYHREDAMKWLSTVRARFGVDVQGFLPYVTGGLAIADIKNVHRTITCCPTLYESNKDGTRYGWVLGAGVEKKIGKSLSISFEALYAEFRKKRGSFDGPTALITGDLVDVYSSRVKLQNNVTTVNFGLNYKF